MENNVKQPDITNQINNNSVVFPTDIYYDDKKRRSYVLLKTRVIFFFGFLVEFFALSWFTAHAHESKIDLIEFYFLSLVFLIFYVLCIYFFILFRNKWYRFFILLISMSRVPLFFEIYATINNDWGFELLLILSIIPSIVWNIIIFFMPYRLLNKIDAAKLQQ